LKPEDIQAACRHLRAADTVMKGMIDAVSVASWYCWRTLDLARNKDTVAKGYPC
jgi:hypothetical protein